MLGNNQFNNLTDSPYDLGAQELPNGWTNRNTFYSDNSLLDFESTLHAGAPFVPAMFTTPTLDANGNQIVQNQVDANREEVIGGHIGISADIDLGGGFSLSQKLRYQNFGWRDHNEITFSAFYTAQSSLLRLNANSNGNINDFVNETRLNYSLQAGSSTHNFSAGIYFSKAAYDRLGGLHWYTSNVDPRPNFGWFGPPGTPAPNRFGISSTTSHQEESVTGFFIGDEMVFNEKLSINAGIRFDQMTGFFNNDPEEVDGVDYNPPTLTENELDFSNWSGSVGVNYLISDRNAVYGSILRAFSLPAVGLATPLPEEDEIVVNTEVGYRSGVGDLGIDVGLFYTKINNRLASVFDPGPGGQTFVIKPVGSNTVLGGELQLTYAPSAVKGLLFRSSITLQDSHYDNLEISIPTSDDDMDETTPEVPDADINGNLFGLTVNNKDAARNLYAIDVSGNRVHNTPNFIFSFMGGYNSEYFGIGFDVAHYAGRYATSLNLYQTPNLTVANANIYGQFPLNNGSNVKLGLRVKNLFNSANPQQLLLGSTNADLLIQKQATPDFNGQLGFAIIQIPRRVLLTLSYDF